MVVSMVEKLAEKMVSLLVESMELSTAVWWDALLAEKMAAMMVDWMVC